MDLKLAIILLVIGFLSITIFAWYGIKWLSKLKHYDKVLKNNILNNVGVVGDAPILKSSYFTVAKKANNAGPNHCDISFKSDLHMLNERVYSRDFISTPAKD